MSDKKINASTPFGALAVRGTDYWWGLVNNHAGVLMVSSSNVAVAGDRERCTEEDQRRGRCLCRVTLTQAGQGTKIERSPECPEGERTNDRRCWRCPSDPYFWSPEEVSAALSQTQFGLASLGNGIVVGAGIVGVGVAAGIANSTSKKLKEKNKPSSD
jgi:hypothetical protein